MGDTVPDPTYDRSRPQPTIAPLYQYPLVNSPGKTAVGVLVKYPPHGSTPPHRHGSASVIGVVTKGILLNKMNDEPTKIVQEGDTWYEAPGCHHKVSDNLSRHAEAEILATFVVDSEVLEKEGVQGLVVYDEEYRDLQKN